jgi:hypothetical protein
VPGTVCSGSVQICYVTQCKRCPMVPKVSTAEVFHGSSNNAFFLRLNYLCPGEKKEVISAVPGSEIVGPYRRIYDKMFIQRITINRGPKNILHMPTDLAYDPGKRGRVLSRVSPNQTTRYLNFYDLAVPPILLH